MLRISCGKLYHLSKEIRMKRKRKGFGNIILIRKGRTIIFL